MPLFRKGLFLLAGFGIFKRYYFVAIVQGVGKGLRIAKAALN